MPFVNLPPQKSNTNYFLSIRLINNAALYELFSALPHCCTVCSLRRSSSLSPPWRQGSRRGKPLSPTPTRRRTPPSAHSRNRSVYMYIVHVHVWMGHLEGGGSTGISHPWGWFLLPRITWGIGSRGLNVDFPLLNNYVVTDNPVLFLGVCSTCTCVCGIDLENKSVLLNNCCRSLLFRLSYKFRIKLWRYINFIHV